MGHRDVAPGPLLWVTVTSPVPLEDRLSAQGKAQRQVERTAKNHSHSLRGAWMSLKGEGAANVCDECGAGVVINLRGYINWDGGGLKKACPVK